MHHQLILQHHQLIPQHLLNILQHPPNILQVLRFINLRVVKVVIHHLFLQHLPNILQHHQVILPLNHHHVIGLKYCLINIFLSNCFDIISPTSPIYSPNIGSPRYSPSSPQYSPQSPASSTISSSISSPRTHDDDDLNDNGDLMD